MNDAWRASGRFRQLGRTTRMFDEDAIRVASPQPDRLDPRCFSSTDVLANNLHPARVLQARRKDVRALLPSVENCNSPGGPSNRTTCRGRLDTAVDQRV